MGYDGSVVAPSLSPRRPGERIKTDRRDALTLARQHRSGDLVAVWVPDEEQEAIRDLVRCREDFKHAGRRVRQRLNSFLLRHGRVYSGGGRWTQAHFRWLETQCFGHPAQQIVFQEYVDGVRHAGRLVEALEADMVQALETWSLAPVVRSLRALRGGNLIVAMTVMSELGDVTFRLTDAVDGLRRPGAQRAFHRSLASTLEAVMRRPTWERPSISRQRQLHDEDRSGVTQHANIRVIDRRHIRLSC